MANVDQNFASLRDASKAMLFEIESWLSARTA